MTFVIAHSVISRRGRLLVAAVLVLLSLSLYLASLYFIAKQPALQHLELDQKLVYETQVANNQSFYAHLVDRHPSFTSYSKQKRCSVYFDELLERSPNFKPWPMANTADVVATNDILTHVRVYHKCFLENNHVWQYTRSSKPKVPATDDENKLSKRLFLLQNFRHLQNTIANSGYPNNCPDLQQRLFPYISGRMPTFVRWTGQRFNSVPDIEQIRHRQSRADEQFDLDSIDYNRSFEYRPEESNFHPCMLNHYYDSQNLGRANGRGIVITINDNMVDPILSLIKTLRVEGNELPISIVKDKLSPENIEKIIQMARKPLSLNDVSENLYKGLSKDKKASVKDDQFVKQEIWFVDVSDCITQDFKSLFRLYSYKFIAILFSSFDDILLMDADAVPLVKPSKLFELSQYKNTKTVFFQDRSELRFNSEEQVNFFKNVLPTKLDRELFDIRSTTRHTLDNRWFGQRFYQYMEAGIVAINKRAHLAGLLTAVQLNFWFSEHLDMTYGDKDLYWLGLSIAGDENYQFNSLQTAVVGQFTPARYYQYPDSHTLEMSSTHPAHISDNDNRTLLWVNSGFEVCKVPSAVDRDLENPQYSHYGKEKLLEFYKSPIRIEAALIPPFVTKDYENDLGEPTRSWDKDTFCLNYNWRAYERVGGLNNAEFTGHVIKYTSEEIRWFDFVGHVWVSR